MPFDIVPVRDPIEISRVYEQMRRNKSLTNSEIYCVNTIKSIVDCYNDDVIILGARDKGGEIIAIRGALIHGTSAIDMFAATSEEGRSVFASYAIFSELVEECKKRSCVEYDLNGINPAQGSGVYLFKKGTGAMPKLTLGEFEWSNSTFLKFIINFKIMV
jgi:lipid II:glycine glycyltransferase (peptidoglycan interpeptide bridge formation enzyme)